MVGRTTHQNEAPTNPIGSSALVPSVSNLVRSLRTDPSRVEAVRPTRPNQRSLAHTRSGQGLGLDNDHLLFRFVLRRSTSGVNSPRSEPRRHSGRYGAAQAISAEAMIRIRGEGIKGLFRGSFRGADTRGGGGGGLGHYLWCGKSRWLIEWLIVCRSHGGSCVEPVPDPDLDLSRALRSMSYHTQSVNPVSIRRWCERGNSLVGNHLTARLTGTH
jgi:hypothetical protein